MASLHAYISDLEWRVSIFKEREDCEGVASLREDLNSLQVEFYSGKLPFGIGVMEISFPIDTSIQYFYLRTFLGKGMSTLVLRMRFI